MRADSELCCPPLRPRSPEFCLVMGHYGPMGGGSSANVTFNVMTQDMVRREKREEREVTQIFWGDRKGDRQKGQHFHSCIKIRRKEGVRLGERDGPQFSGTVPSSWARPPLQHRVS